MRVKAVFTMEKKREKTWFKKMIKTRVHYRRTSTQGRSVFTMCRAGGAG